MSMTATNNNNNNNNDNINGEQQDLTSYLKSMFIELNGNINDVHSNLQPQPQQTSNSAIDKIIVNGDGSVISNSDVKHRDDCSRQQQQCETKKSELTKPFVITNVGVQQIIDDNNNNVVAVTDDDDDSRNKIETKNTKDTLNKINGSCASTVQTNNSSTSSLSSSSMMMNEEKNNQSIILNSNDQKQDIVSKQQPKEPFNDQNQKQNQNDSLTDNNNNNLGNNDDHHRKKQEPNKIKHTNDHGDDENDDVQTNTSSDQIQARENFIVELMQKIDNRKNHDQPFNTDNIDNPTTIEQHESNSSEIDENLQLNNLESSSLSSSPVENQSNESGIHSTESGCSSVSQVEISSINSVETNNSNNGVNQRSNDPDNQIYSRSTSMVEVFDSDTIPLNKQKISNFRFESLKQERPVTRTRVKELREFWNNRSLIDKATQNNK